MQLGATVLSTAHALLDNVVPTAFPAVCGFFKAKLHDHMKAVSETTAARDVVVAIGVVVELLPLLLWLRLLQNNVVASDRTNQ